MTHPRDHVLNLAAQLRSDMTTLANVTCKVRVNGGAATTYTNVSSPAITQYGDCTYAYELKIAASTFADGDVVEITWFYSATAYAIGNYTIGPAAVDGAHYTNARGDKLDNADAAVSTRLATSGYTAPDNADIAAVKTELDALRTDYTTARAGKLDNVDVSVSTRLPTASYTAPDNADVAAIKAKTDNLPADPASQASVLAAIPSAATIASTVWAAGARTLTAIGDSTGVTTLVSRLTSGRATNLDNLDVTTSSRLAASSYTAPDNATIGVISSAVSALTTAVAAISPSAIASSVWAAAVRTLSRAPRSEG